MTDDIKPIAFVGSSRDDLKALPGPVCRQIGYELQKVQLGFEPNDWKPFESIGPGVKEIRVREDSGAYRAIYVAKFAEAVYVLHCFQKKTAKTGKVDIDLATKRYKALMRERMK